jgi:hypothetical protein
MESNRIDRACFTCLNWDELVSINNVSSVCWDCNSTTSKIHWEAREEKLTPLEYAALHFGTEDNTVFGEEDEDYSSPLLSQIGGDHYSKLKIQPMEYSMANKLDACQHTAIKYITRFRDKGTPMADLDKAIHCIQMLKEFEQNEQYQ